VLRALAKERDDRWPSMVALADAIAATLPGQPSARVWLDASRDAPRSLEAQPAAEAQPSPEPRAPEVGPRRRSPGLRR
jgi:hypothetical protein